MDANAATELILQYRYWILIPLTFIEGPIVAFVAGTLASLSYFNIYALAVLFFVRDIGMDAVYYALGHYGAKTAFVQRMLKKFNIKEEHLKEVRALWDKNPGRTMFVGKLSYGIAQAFIVLAGTVGMPLKTFFKYGVIVAVVQYGGLLFLGYFFGGSLGGNAARMLQNIQYIIAGATLFIAGYYIFSWYMRRKFYKEEV